MGILRSHRFGLGAAAVVIGATAIAVPASLGNAAGVTPSLRLVTGIHHLKAIRFDGTWDLFIPESVYVEATHGPFEVDVTRSHGNLQLEQVSRHGSSVKRIRAIRPPDTVRLPLGLPKFFSVALKDSTGKVLTSAHPSFCPTTSYDSQRVDPGGADNPTYPETCGDHLTHATVWGIDQGWADPEYLDLTASPDVVPDGTYTLSVAIAPTYRHQLGISAADAQVSLALTVATVDDGCSDICPPGVGEGFTQTRALARGQAAGRTARAAQAAALASSQRYAGQADASGGLPDLIALPAHGLSTSHESHSGKDYLNFGATIWNAGPGTFDVEGFRHNGRPTMQARQYIYHHGRSSDSTKIGSFEFDNRKGHHHWHLEDVARYDLLDSHHDQVVVSDKQSFCLAPTNAIDLTVPGALWNPDNVGLTSACPTEQSLWLRETLPVGWGDTYVQQKGGQAFDITDVPNGSYLIRVTTNPFGRIHETTRKNNTALLAVTLGGTPGARTVTKSPLNTSG